MKKHKYMNKLGLVLLVRSRSKQSPQINFRFTNSHHKSLQNTTQNKNQKTKSKQRDKTTFEITFCVNSNVESLGKYYFIDVLVKFLKSKNYISYSNPNKSQTDSDQKKRQNIRPNFRSYSGITF